MSAKDTDKITYKQVMDGIQKMQEKSASLKEQYRTAHEELRDMTKQRDLIKEYLEKDKQKDRPAPSKKPKQREIL